MKKSSVRKLMFALLALFVSWFNLPLAHASPETWTVTGAMIDFRSKHTATLLTNGKVLVTGGIKSGTFISSSELYEPSTGTWTSTGSMNSVRWGHTATLLANGKVLVAGGYNGSGGRAASAELYDPATGTWTITGSMSLGRSYHRAALLASGKVLVVGGADASAELYDPATGTWTSTGSMNRDRSEFTATLLTNGKVLVAGSGGPLSSAELYDPLTETWTGTGSMISERYAHTATLLASGKVLVAGGLTSSGYLISTELYNPATGTWTITGSVSSARRYHTDTLLANGKVLIAGGDGDGSPRLSSAELYDPATGTWTITGLMSMGRSYHTATLLDDEKVLVAGWGGTIPELYNPTFILTTAAQTHGQITGNASPYAPNATASLSAIPSPGYLFTGWTGDVTGADNPLRIVMSTDKTIGATFTEDTNDDDGDGLTNYQEIVIYQSNPQVKDTDGDGFEDGFEVITGFNPALATSTPDAQSSIRTAVEFRFNAANGVDYRIEDSTDLIQWDTVEPSIIGQSAVVTRFYSIENQPHRYFRVKRN